MSEEVNVKELWEQTRQMLHEGPINRALWDAAATIQPITIDQDTLILGLTAGQIQHASYLETAINKSRLQQILQTLILAHEAKEEQYPVGGYAQFFAGLFTRIGLFVRKRQYWQRDPQHSCRWEEILSSLTVLF